MQKEATFFFFFNKLALFIPFKEWGFRRKKKATVKPLISRFWPGLRVEVERGHFPASFVCREKSGRGRRGGKATSWAECKVSIWPLRLTPPCAHSACHVALSGIRAGLVFELAWTRQGSHSSIARQHRESSNWAIFQVSFEDTFFSPKAVDHLIGRQSLPRPLRLRVGRRSPTSLTAMARGALRN